MTSVDSLLEPPSKNRLWVRPGRQASPAIGLPCLEQPTLALEALNSRLGPEGDSAPPQNEPRRRLSAGRWYSPPPSALSLLLDALNTEDAEAGVLTANLGHIALLFVLERLDPVHVREL